MFTVNRQSQQPQPEKGQGKRGLWALSKSVDQCTPGQQWGNSRKAGREERDEKKLWPCDKQQQWGLACFTNPPVLYDLEIISGLPQKVRSGLNVGMSESEWGRREGGRCCRCSESRSLCTSDFHCSYVNSSMWSQIMLTAPYPKPATQSLHFSAVRPSPKLNLLNLRASTAWKGRC